MEISSFISNFKTSTGPKKWLSWSAVFLLTFVLLDWVVFQILFIGIDGSHRIMRGMDSAEILIVGSSHVTWDIQTEILEKELSLKTHRIGLPAADVKTRIATVEEYFKHSKKLPKIILMEADRYLFHPRRYFIPRGALLPYWHRGMFRELLTEAWGDEFLFKASKLSRALSANGEFNSFLERIVLKIENSGKGNREPSSDPQLEKLVATLSNYPEENDNVLVGRLERFLNSKLLKTARNSGTQIIFLDTPNVRLPGNRSEFKKSREILKYLSRKYAVPVFKPFHKEETEAHWFLDATHLNSKGAEEFTRRLAIGLKSISE